MFSKKTNKSISQVVLFLTLATILTIFIVGSFVVILFKVVDIRTRQLITDQHLTANNISSLLLESKYQESLNNILQTVHNSDQSTQKLFETIEETLLKITVPERFLQSHLHAFLAIEDLKVEVNTLSLEKMRARLTKILEEMM
ncbi:MAG: hypothetical protein COX81_00420 [Candidatus Magasanikbacteria bacterium CG_4_10_14_0_2_um_filter_37_12]|uniref:Uncharacterized protein n=1 Tax=Candidatus Magasanikbacteria bacterium CG_4_10_14_0_2_um_filter_37_12 TaxID=1974637 RepID=A0A2M7V9R0_9BACT|nr:MAG: hypothetical protein COX81_00420 [Candidatus Magasanikbacteria bacterium CG_4_10_14_0_2_um_filter_37_12]